MGVGLRGVSQSMVGSSALNGSLGHYTYVGSVAMIFYYWTHLENIVDYSADG